MEDEKKKQPESITIPAIGTNCFPDPDLGPWPQKDKLPEYQGSGKSSFIPVTDEDFPEALSEMQPESFSFADIRELAPPQKPIPVNASETKWIDEFPAESEISSFGATYYGNFTDKAETVSDEKEPVTVSRLKELTDEAWRLKAVRDEAKKAHETASQDYEAARRELLSLLEVAELDKFEGDECSVSVVSSTYVTTPKTPEDKEALFDFLKFKGVFMDYVTVNSQSLNSFFRAEEELAAQAGDYLFVLPGCGEPGTRTELRLNKKRKGK